MYIGAHGTLVVGVLQITQRLIITICYVITKDTLSALAYSSQPQWVGVHWGLTCNELVSQQGQVKSHPLSIL